MEVIPFNEFMQDYTLGSGMTNVGISDFINGEDVEMAYWLIGGLGGVLVVLYFLESQGIINVNDKLIKLGMVGVYIYLAYLVFVEKLLPMVL